MKEIRGPDAERRELAYQQLNGFTKTEEEDGRKSGTQVRIKFLVDEIYRHRLNLCNRVSLDFEDEDLEAIVTAYEQLSRLCAGFMYNQGWYDRNRGL